jgi:hypothetical protein
MTKRTKVIARKGNLRIMDRVDPHAFDGACAFCGKVEELRPYGPNNENICFDCMMKDEETAKRKFKELLEGGDQ